MKPCFLVFLTVLVAACQSANSEYVETDKIHLLFGDYEYTRSNNGAIDDKEKIIYLPEDVRLSIQMDIDHVTWVEMSDVSEEDHTCIGWGYSWANHYSHASPSTIVSFTLNPTANIKKIDFDMPLPCAAFHQKFYYLIKVKSLEGNYFVRKKFPAKVFYHPSSEY
ncbi:MAG: hypothetical protein HY080_09900 [Gammaproteobacteria bacterium]|nr:hypothetical protein [Gammaproteobacteria bacterium]